MVVRQTWGAYMAGREMSALRRLAGIAGFPQDAFRLDRYAIAYRYVPGTEIGNAEPGSLAPAFFESLESLVARMHERDVAHLDIRNGWNVLVTGQGDPFILDFQSHIRLTGLPRYLRRLLIDVDRSGVYKHWHRFSPESLGEERAARLRRLNRLRRYWILKGYLGFKPGPRRQDTGRTERDEEGP